jgi:hypothetical protein
MTGRDGTTGPGAFDGGRSRLSEIDCVLALIGAAHWIDPFDTASEVKRRGVTPQSSSSTHMRCDHCPS